MQLSEKDKGCFLTDVQWHYITSGTYRISKAIFQHKNVQYLHCLNPDFKNTPKSVKIIAKLGYCLHIDIEVDTLFDRWKIIKLNQ